MNFIPLHIRSGYSFLRSALTVDRILDGLKKINAPAGAICDINVAYGWMEFATKAQENKINPILGLDIILNDEMTISLFALSEDGYQNLSKLSYLASQKKLLLTDLATCTDGVAAILGTRQEHIMHLSDSHDNQLRDLIKSISALFAHFFLGLEINSEPDIAQADFIRQFADKYNYQLIAFPTFLYLKPEDAYTLEILDAIANDNNLTDNENTLDGPYYFLESTKIMEFYRTEEIAATATLAASIKYDIFHHRGHMLTYPLPPSVNAGDYLKQMAEDGLHNHHFQQMAPYEERLKYELNVIHEMGYDDYFLIVQDYVNHAKAIGIPVGPGRGSAAGSLVSYALGITEIDPLPENLLFERFLNPARRTMPDIDIDFADNRRDEIIEYLRSRYGQDHIANIVTFQTIGARQSLRDIGRVFNFPTTHIDLLSKSLGIYNYSLHDAYRHIPAFKKLIDSDHFYLRLVTLASKIEGLPRQSGLHAAGIVLNDTPLSECIPVRDDGNGHLICQYEMTYLEAQGFLKMDILGLINLSTIESCLQDINHNHGTDLTLETIPYEKKEIFDLISAGMTMGIFQLESTGMLNAIKQIQPSCFEDIVAILALFRPGPMQNIPLYAARKRHEKPVTYISPALEPILSSTYGIIVYQEQIMQIAQVMAGMSLADADLFRRAISKKDANKLAKLRVDFISGSMSNGYSEKIAQEMFDTIYQFADYGFNKSHSVAYARLACQMAYLKANYAPEFYAAILGATNSTNDTKFQSYISEIRRRKIHIIGPDINRSSNVFTVNENALLFPLSAIHGINNMTATAIITIRNQAGPFKDFPDFIIRMQAAKITLNQSEKLIDAGAFDHLYSSRASLRHNLPTIFSFAAIVGPMENAQTQLSLTHTPPPAMEQVRDDPLENLEREYETLGLMLSANPLSYKEEAIKKAGAEELSVLTQDNKYHDVVGIIRNIKIIRTRAGKPMAFVRLYDQNSELDLTFFPEFYQTSLPLLKKNNTVIVKAHADQKRERTYIADAIRLLED